MRPAAPLALLVADTRNSLSLGGEEAPLSELAEEVAASARLDLLLDEPERLLLWVAPLLLEAGRLLLAANGDGLAGDSCASVRLAALEDIV